MTIQIGRGVILDHGATHDSYIHATVEVPYCLGQDTSRFDGAVSQKVVLKAKSDESPASTKRRIRKQAEQAVNQYFNATDIDDNLFHDVFDTVERRVAVAQPVLAAKDNGHDVFDDDHELELLFEEINGRMAS